MKDSNYFKQRFEFIKGMYDPDMGLEEFKELKDDIKLEMIDIDNTRDPEFVKLRSLKNEIGRFLEENEKKENTFYDPEAELDHMFPDRHDDDFDEDSMSWDSVFGND